MSKKAPFILAVRTSEKSGVARPGVGQYGLANLLTGVVLCVVWTTAKDVMN